MIDIAKLEANAENARIRFNKVRKGDDEAAIRKAERDYIFAQVDLKRAQGTLRHPMTKRGRSASAQEKRKGKLVAGFRPHTPKENT